MLDFWIVFIALFFSMYNHTIFAKDNYSHPPELQIIFAQIKIYIKQSF